MSKIDLSLYLVLDAAACGSNERMLQVAEQAAESGVSVIQLRGHKTDWTKRDWFTMAMALRPICQRHHIPLIINDQVDIALASKADGVHVGQKDLPVSVVRKLIGADRILGLSTHNMAQVLVADPTIVDYIGMGPVYATQSKKDADATIGLSLLAEMAAVKKVPGVAIGGINHKRVGAVRSINPDGIAVISAICGQKNIAQAVKGLR